MSFMSSIMERFKTPLPLLMWFLPREPQDLFLYRLFYAAFVSPSNRVMEVKMDADAHLAPLLHPYHQLTSVTLLHTACSLTHNCVASITAMNFHHRTSPVPVALIFFHSKQNDTMKGLLLFCFFNKP